MQTTRLFQYLAINLKELFFNTTMKNLTVIGVILLALAFLLYYLQSDFNFVQLFQPVSLMGILAGIGIGLIIGGVVGYVSKGAAIKAEQKRREFKQLQKEKEALEKQAASLAQQIPPTTSETSTPKQPEEKFFSRRF